VGGRYFASRGADHVPQSGWKSLEIGWRCGRATWKICYTNPRDLDRAQIWPISVQRESCTGKDNGEIGYAMVGRSRGGRSERSAWAVIE
jgi:hypothetical protein